MTGRILIVGGVAAGASAAAKARRTNESVEIVMFDRGPYMSYANCGLPYYVGGEIASRDALFVTDPDRFTGFFKVDVQLNTEVVGICASDRTASYIDREKGRSTLSYDRLILATGTVPIVPPIAGLDSPNIFYCRTVPDVDAIMQRLSQLLPREMEGGHFLNVKEAGFQALVIGGGYIGLECAEQLMQRGPHHRRGSARPTHGTARQGDGTSDRAGAAGCGCRGYSQRRRHSSRGRR